MSAPARLVRMESSSIDAVGYDSATQRLTVRFLGSGNTYVYFGVEAEAFEALLAAPSKGRHLNLHIKGAYPYQRL